jgi:hypothetical protein
MSYLTERDPNDPNHFIVDPALNLERLRTKSFATSNKLGLPLIEAYTEDDPVPVTSTQTILPVICGGRIGADGELEQGMYGACKILGWLPIASTEFDGTERTFTTSDGPIPITTVTLPYKADQNTAETQRVRQYMAAVFPETTERDQPWLGYTNFISTNESEYAMQWFMPTMGQMYRLNLGPLIKDLTIRMDADAGAPPAPPTPPDADNGTLRWVTSVSMNDMQQHCPTIDFNWVNLFNAQTAGVDPLRIEIVSNPPGGALKTTIVPYPVVAPLGGIEFNTLRIIKLHEVAAGDYVFNYQIVDTNGGITPVVLTLTVV